MYKLIFVNDLKISINYANRHEAKNPPPTKRNLLAFMKFMANIKIFISGKVLENGCQTQNMTFLLILLSLYQIKHYFLIGYCHHKTWNRKGVPREIRFSVVLRFLRTESMVQWLSHRLVGTWIGS